MRWTLFLPALLAMACSASANDRVVQATIFDQTKPNCVPCGCSEPVGCAAPAGCSTAGGCAGACGQSTPSCGCGACDASNSGWEDYCCSCNSDGKCKGGKCKGCKDGKCKGSHCAATLSGNGKCNVCNMPQHHRYMATDHGYYYFRPYNYRHIARHQEAVTRWGGDPRNPYSNEIFNAIYAEEPEAVNWHDVPVQMPTAPEVVPPGAPAAEPPVPMPTIDETARVSRINQLRFISSQRTR